MTSSYRESWPCRKKKDGKKQSVPQKECGRGPVYWTMCVHAVGAGHVRIHNLETTREKKNFYSFYLFCCLRKKGGGGRRELNKKRERERVCFLGCLATNRTTIHSLETRRRKNLKRVAGRKCARNKAPMDVIVDVSGRRQNFSLISLLTPPVNGRPVWTDEKGTNKPTKKETVRLRFWCVMDMLARI